MGSTNCKFVHRVNRDGTYDSICRECFVTVATELREADLEPLENQHLCDPWLLEKFAKHSHKPQ